MTSLRATLLALRTVLIVTSLAGCAAEAGPGPSGEGSSGALTSRPYFEVWQADSGDHYFHFSAANHEIVLASQAYSSRTAALNGVLSVMDNGELRSRYRLNVAENGQHYFTLTARNGRVIAVSELYQTRWGAEEGILNVARNIGSYLDFQADRAGARFEVFQGVDSRYYFNLHAANGAIVLSSQGYADEATALNGTFSVADYGLDTARFDVRGANGGGYYFNLTAPNGQVIATSEVYTTRYSAERARNAIIALLPEVDLL